MCPVFRPQAIDERSLLCLIGSLFHKVRRKTERTPCFGLILGSYSQMPIPEVALIFRRTRDLRPPFLVRAGSQTGEDRSRRAGRRVEKPEMRRRPRGILRDVHPM